MIGGRAVYHELEDHLPAVLSRPAVGSAAKVDEMEKHQDSREGAPLTGKPVHPSDSVLLEAYRQERIKQVDRFDDLAKELLKLELVIPGIYAAVLRLVAGQEPVVSVSLVCLAFALWLAALALTLVALFPRQWKVLDDVVRRGHTLRTTEALSIEGYFQKSALHKRRFLLYAVPVFFAGILVAVLAVFV